MTDTTLSAAFVDRLRSRRDDLLGAWIDAVGTAARGRITPAEVERELGVLADAILDALAGGARSASGTGFDEVRAVLVNLSRAKALQGFSPSETAQFVFALKEATLELVGVVEGGVDFVLFSRLVDELGLFTFDTYVRAREAIITTQAEQLLELTTPVVKIWDGIVAVPLIGTLDSARTQVVMEKLLQALVDTGSEHAIVDITGVPAVDTQVAQHILKTVVAARLMGADCVISGIRPQIAHTIVALGIEFGDIVTKATLADALAHTLRKSGFSVSRRPRGDV